MGLRNLKSVEVSEDFDLVQETLSDGSHVYSIWVKAEDAGAEINCVSYEDAEELYVLLTKRDKYYL